MTLAAFLQHLAFALCLAGLSAAAVRAMIAFPILDHPNARSAHSRPTPRGGGVGVVLAFIAGMVVLYLFADFARLAERQFLGVILAAIAIAGVALVDDMRSLSARLRFACQLAAALVAIGSGLSLSRLALPYIGYAELGPLGLGLTLIWILGCTNAVNFMDGLDGLVGGTLLIACAALAAIAAHQGGWFVYAAALFLAAGFAGFLPFNLHPARIFMGDVGSQFAGFMLAVLAVAAARFDATQVSFLIVPLLLLGLLWDAAFTLARRGAMGDRVGAPHRTHLYQMAQRSGVPVRVVAATHWGFALFHAGLAAWFLALPGLLKPLVVLPALALQLGWTLYVALRVRRAGLSWRG
ncbi:undecaprenyl/decaprenyl-phosphate alpha-N-acetylglucosaminyl 1-phosphate transferase [Siccirubricoccus sp. KC 17139]|uniref:Undecaprenyl/decaprenyl-phosphate alpha-N-acetylglucosaminyl 1-phosphate transferase n=1 Tax=Siccirubricoccus soli TaxID=2899147 RepID=A0ABT1CYK7_9PROT|nr:undecaprenyl/decaprenyl-phosphate alpha-N-acetylglucosaminyl 1-phosphate transferase [Siccirubricoccus soli]MCO6414741.1 undecaprenyl/decaprenyl-phosphate alpha-N-acetylglucosaminyl 1-phosphate transferase [Siccirubricoccus soli]MCP2680871.1 undecaprenyl/decaprenyl-phosphate alpha-N-acetylglucosaminyl 1-phosphate transferase [Siccirubricoccus soli]